MHAGERPHRSGEATRERGGDPLPGPTVAERIVDPDHRFARGIVGQQPRDLVDDARGLGPHQTGAPRLDRLGPLGGLAQHQHYTSTDPDDDGPNDRPDIVSKEVPTVAQFIPRYLKGHCEANRLRPMQGLQWSDIDLKRGTLTVARSIYRGHVGPPKGGKPRTIPLAERLCDALTTHRHLRGPHVLWTRFDTRPSSTSIRSWLTRLQGSLGFKRSGPHILRHTFCSHLAMAGKSVLAVKELAGHQDIETTQRYMHLAPRAARDAIDGLRRPPNWRHGGDGSLGVIQLQ